MDPTENPGNRIGRTIWTVWGYLSGAVARFLRPEVTDEGNQGVRTRTDDIDLKSAVNKIDREVTAKNSNNEGKETNQIDSAEVKCSPSKVRVQVASVQWENTDVVKDDNNDELHVHTTKKQTYHCAVWSPGTDTDNEGCMVDALVEKEAVSSDEVQAENIYANNEFKESETAHELEETGKIEQKYGDNEDIEERDQNHKGEKCAKNRKDAYETDVMVQFDQDVEQEKQINMADHGETEGIAGFKHADTHLIDEQIVDQKDRGGIAYVSKNEVEEMMPETRGATEQDKEKKTVQDLEEIWQLERNDGDNEDKEECDQNHEEEKCAVESEDLDNADVKVQSELYGQDVEHEMKISMMDHAEKEGIGGFKHSDEHPIDEKENNLDQKDQEKTENDEEQGLESQVQDLQKSEDPDNANVMVQCEQDVEQEKKINIVDHGETERIAGFKHADEHLIEEKENNLNQTDQEKTENDEEKGLESQVQDLQKSKDPDNADILVQCELYGQDVEQDKLIRMMDHAEKEGIGGFKHSDEHLIDEIEEQIVDQKDQGRTENDEDQGTESQVQDLLPQLEYLKKYSDEIACISKNEVEEMMPETRCATEQGKEKETAQDLE
ncbi:interaptin-like [Cyprinus carpio]|uniref:Interaptin-like n=1 Tax=Cyprinus carpio TaxID=7962 RepID=A0A9Q9YR47_CYPCA|nr:interaptin-like [Cyprinus carpio]